MTEKELEREIERGHAAQCALANHLWRMGAAENENTVEVAGRSYRVTVEQLPHPSDFVEEEC